MEARGGQVQMHACVSMRQPMRTQPPRRQIRMVRGASSSHSGAVSAEARSIKLAKKTRKPRQVQQLTW